MPYKTFVISTVLLIRCHIETDYYQEDIHFDLNRRKKLCLLTVELLNFRFKNQLPVDLEKVFYVTNLLV
jgi:hypothetical protein